MIINLLFRILIRENEATTRFNKREIIKLKINKKNFW